MHNKQIILQIYRKKLGDYLKEQMKEKNLKQDEVGLTCGKDDIEMLSGTAVREILKGKRNMTSKAADAFQESLGINTPKDLFSPMRSFVQALFQKF